MWDLPGAGFEPVSPALADGFLTTVPPGKSLISFSCLIALARTFRTILNRGGDSGHSSFVASVRGRALRLSLLNVTHCEFFIDSFYYVEVASFCSFFVVYFYYERMLNFVKCFFYTN